jgi:hypothetical protein
MMKHMEENIKKVRREKKTILYAIVGLLPRKIYIGIKLTQIYIICDTWREAVSSIHSSEGFYIWLYQSAIISIKNRK